MLSKKDFIASLDNLFKKHICDDGPGAALNIIQGGKTLHKAGYGLANIEAGIPITPATVFHFASSGKQFTTMAIMMLCTEGLLAYDDPIGMYLPELGHFRGVTIRNLMQHTSGIPDYYEDEDLHARLVEINPQPHNADALALLKQQEALIFEPGKQFIYSNTGFEVLGTLIERLSGQNFPQFMQERIFGPLGMRHTFSLPHPQRFSFPNLAHSYTQENGKILPIDSDPFDNLVGSGSIYTSVEDMLLYDNILYTERLISQNTLKEAFLPTTLNDGAIEHYGFAWELKEFHGQQIIGHSGSWLAYNSYYARIPTRRMAIVILANSDYILPDLFELIQNIVNLIDKSS